MIAPVTVGPPPFPVSGPLFGSGLGPYSEGSALWLICSSTSSTISSPAFLSAYKSIDGGANWTLAVVGPQLSVNLLAVVRRSGASLVISYENAPGTVTPGFSGLDVVDFDMTGSAFGAVNHSPQQHNSAGSAFRLELRGAEIDLIYCDGNLSNIVAFVFAGGSWSSSIPIASVSTAQIMDSTLDGNGNVRILWFNMDSGFTQVQELNDYVFNGSAVIATYTAASGAVANSLNPFDLEYPMLLYSSKGDTIGAVCLFDNGASAGIILFAGTTSSSTVYTSQIVYTVTAPDALFGVTIIAVAGAVNIFCSHEVDPGLSEHDFVQLSAAATLAGPWVTSLYYDLQAQPPTPAPLNSLIETIASTEFGAVGAGQAGVVIGVFDVTQPPRTTNVVQVFLKPAAAPGAEVTLTFDGIKIYPKP